MLPTDTAQQEVIYTPDQRLRVFISSTLKELAQERDAARAAIEHMRMTPVMFEHGARPHPPRDLYRAYLAQSDIFIGLYWQSYGWVASSESISGLEEEYRLSNGQPKLIYIKIPAAQREPGLTEFLQSIKREDSTSYKYFSDADELHELIENDLALLLTERFEQAQRMEVAPVENRIRPNNLPAPRNTMIDRTWEVAAARDMLLGDEVALLTLIGPGGVGKSRLALHIARDLLDEFEDGAFLVRLSPLSDATRVVKTIAQTLNLNDIADDPTMLEHLKDALRDKHMLLLLDNFEHVIDAATAIGELLEACVGLKIIVTSRAPLHVRAERQLPVLPLSSPEPGRAHDIGELLNYTAVKLFVERAQAVNPGFALTEENALAVAEICRRLDGLPLAIELAAARIRILSPQTMQMRLNSRLDLLRSGTRDLPLRQQTLRNAIDWSYDLLDESARTLFRRVAVMAGRWTLESAEFIAYDEALHVSNILGALEMLVDNNLVKQLNDAYGEPRFGMLETINEYALERLIESGEEQTMRERHAEYYLSPAMAIAPHAQMTDWLEMEYDNVHAALAYSRKSNREAIEV